MSIEEKYVRAGKIKTRYWVSGDQGPAVVLIHGLGTSAEIWSPNIGALAASYRVYVPDLVGHGYTDKPEDVYTLDYIMHHMHSFVKAVNLDQAVFAGVSMGGGIVLKYAVDYPEMVRKLILVDSAGLGRDVAPALKLASIPFIANLGILKNRRALSFYMKGLVRDPGVMTEEIIDLYYKIFSLEGAMRAFSNVLITSCNLGGVRKDIIDHIASKLPALKVPTLILWGKQDPSLPVKHAYAGNKIIPGSQLHIFEDCGHFPNLEKTEEFNRIVLEFLAK